MVNPEPRTTGRAGESTAGEPGSERRAGLAGKRRGTGAVPQKFLGKFRTSFGSAITPRWSRQGRENNQKGQSGAPETVLQTLPVRRAT
jgi:hypothetical protein